MPDKSQTQYDSKVRAVSLYNLEAMCARVSGVCHTFKVVKVTRTRVHVEYSNPSEYGSPQPMVAVYPTIPGFDPGGENPLVILQLQYVKPDRWDGEGWQAFTPLEDCPTLWRDPKDGVWRTREEIKGVSK